jgi:hypothetical protein
MMNRQQVRAIARMILAAFAGIVVGWLSVAALVVLSILWPANQVPHVMLGIWLCVIAIYLGLSIGRSRDSRWLLHIAYAPLTGPIMWVALTIRDARRKRNPKR